jgi:hypothetical protein
VTAVLWALQLFLGTFIALASGAPKLLLPPDALPLPIPLPDALVRAIGVAEVLGGLGLILPGLLRVRTGLTPLAAAGLVLVTAGATVYQLAAGQPGSALFAAVLGGLFGAVGYGRWRVAPLAERGARVGAGGRPPAAETEHVIYS